MREFYSRNKRLGHSVVHHPYTRGRPVLTRDADSEVGFPRRLSADVEVRLAIDGHLVETFTLNCDPARVEDWNGDRAACGGTIRCKADRRKWRLIMIYACCDACIPFMLQFFDNYKILAHTELF